MAGRILIKSGTVITESGTVDADILAEDGVITAIRRRISARGTPVVDASEAHVFPGGVDPHVHLETADDPNMDPIVERVDTATRAALLGGTTTVGLYVRGVPSQPPARSIRALIHEALERASTDFFLNLLCTPADAPEEVVPHAIDLGVRNFKVFLAYKTRGLMADDAYLVRLMQQVRRHNALLLVHPENGVVSEYLEQAERNRNVDPPSDAYLRTSPGILEAEGACRAVLLSRLMGCRVLFVHLTSSEAAEIAAWVKSGPDAERVSWETQPHYLLLTNQEVLDRGPLAKVGPPLRDSGDVRAVWKALSSGWISHLSSDHAPRTVAIKTRYSDILSAPYGGISGVELLLALAHSLGPESGRFDFRRMAELTATNAAKAYGLYPRKGVIKVGSDADLAVIPKDGTPRAIQANLLHGNADYTVYRGVSSRGFPRVVVRAGMVVVNDGEMVGEGVPSRHLVPS